MRTRFVPFGSGGRVDDLAVGGRLVAGVEAEQGLEGGVGVAAGRRVPCITVPALTDVCAPQPLHCQSSRRR